MIQIVIVDDDKDFSEEAAEIVHGFFEETKEMVSVRQYNEGSTLLDDLAANKNYDIYFLDIEMPEINGLDLAQKIKAVETDANIVFISAYEKYAVPSYKVRAYYYILKEGYKSEIPVILRQIWQERLEAEKNYFVIKSASQGKKIRLDDIVYLLREKKYVIFRCIEGKEYKARGALGEIYCKLPSDRFVYIDNMK